MLQTVCRPRPPRLLRSARSRQAGAVTFGRPGGEPFVDFSLDPGDSMITNRYRFGKFAGLALAAKVVTRIIDPFGRPETLEID
jgi:hypothetical protein